MIDYCVGQSTFNVSLLDIQHEINDIVNINKMGSTCYGYERAVPQQMQSTKDIYTGKVQKQEDRTKPKVHPKEDKHSTKVSLQRQTIYQKTQPQAKVQFKVQHYQSKVINQTQLQPISLDRNIRAQFQSEEYVDEVCMAQSNLRKVSQDEMKNPMHRNHVAIVWPNPQNPQKPCRGTGILISKNLVLTSAHNLYFKSRRIDNNKVKIYCGRSSKLIKYHTIQDVFIPKQFLNNKTCQSFQYDYALIKLKGQASACSFLELKCQFDSHDAELAIYGYPGSKYQKNGDNDIEIATQWGNSASIAIFEIRKEIGEILHEISTEAGQSGSPIIQIVNKKAYIIGIHKGYKKVPINDQTRQINSGKLVTKEMLQILKQQAQRMNGKMFLIADQKEKKSQAESWRQIAKEFHAKKEFQKAIEYYKKAISHGPQNAWILCHLGLALKAVGQVDQALYYYKQAIQVDSKCYISYNQMGNLLTQQQKNSEAITSYLAAIQINSRYWEAYYNLGLVFLKIRKYDQAIEKFRQVLKLQPKNAQAMNALAKSLFLNKKISQSIEYFKKAMLTADKSYFNPYHDIVFALQASNRIPEAIRNLQKGLKINPNDEDMAKQLKRLKSLK